MATPRRRWVRLLDAFPPDWDDATCLRYVRLVQHLHRRWAEESIPVERAGEAVLLPGAIQEITGLARPDHAVRALLECASSAHVDAHAERIHRRTVVRLSWPNFAESQGYASRRQPERCPGPGQPETPAPGDQGAAPRKPREAQPPPDEALDLAEFLRAKILADSPGARVPENRVPWAREIARMNAIDGRPWAEIRAGIEWVFGPNQRSGAPFVVLSAKSLREKFDRMRIAARRQKGGGDGHNRGGRLAEAARNVIGSL